MANIPLVEVSKWEFIALLSLVPVIVCCAFFTWFILWTQRKKEKEEARRNEQGVEHLKISMLSYVAQRGTVQISQLLLYGVLRTDDPRSVQTAFDQLIRDGSVKMDPSENYVFTPAYERSAVVIASPAAPGEERGAEIPPSPPAPKKGNGKGKPKPAPRATHGGVSGPGETTVTVNPISGLACNVGGDLSALPPGVALVEKDDMGRNVLKSTEPAKQAKSDDPPPTNQPAT